MGWKQNLHIPNDLVKKILVFAQVGLENQDLDPIFVHKTSWMIPMKAHMGLSNEGLFLVAFHYVPLFFDAQDMFLELFLYIDGELNSKYWWWYWFLILVALPPAKR